MKKSAMKKCLAALAAATSLSMVCTSVNAQGFSRVLSYTGNETGITLTAEDGSETAVSSTNLLPNPSFEEGLEPWNGSSYGTATNNPCTLHEGCGPTHYWLDGGWIGQVVNVPYTGYYKVSTCIAIGGEDTNAYFGANNNTTGVRHGVTIKTSEVGNGYTWQEQQVWLNQGDAVDVFVLAKNSEWVNGDNFCLEYNTMRYANLAVNPEFNAGIQTWETSGSASISDGQAVLTSAEDTISQNITIPMDGPYYAEVELEGAEGAVVALGDQKEESISGDETVRLSAEALTKDSTVTISISGKATVKKVTVKYDLSQIPNDNAPVISDLVVSGDAIAGETLKAVYNYSDEDGHLEGPTTFRWMIADSVDGEYTELSNGSASRLTVKEDWEGKYLKLEVTPVDQYEKEGTTVSSEPVGPVNVNLIQNAGFESKTKNWSGDITVSKENPCAGNASGVVAAGGKVTQEITVEKDGYYDFSADVDYAGSEKGTISILDDGGNVLGEVAVTPGEGYNTVSIKDIPLEYRQQVTVCLEGAEDAAYSVDRLTLFRNREKEVPSFNSIVSFEVSPTAFDTTISLSKKTVTLTYLYGDDVTALTVKAFELSKGASISVKEGDVLDLTDPVEVTVTASDGKEATWTICAEHKAKRVKLSSSNDYLEDTFNWAAQKLDQFVMTGKSGLINKDENRPNGTGTAEYIPSYWAGYYDRTAFYSRDFVHQSTGAQIAGLSEENYTMFETFAKECTEARKYYTVWALNFDGTPHTIDYYDDDCFVREVPAQFELVEKAYEQYLWSGDSRYIEDEELFDFYTNVMTKYVELHDTNGNGIAEGTGGGIFEGTASYNERSSEPLLESGDGIASQYQATLAYAGILDAKADLLEERIAAGQVTGKPESNKKPAVKENKKAVGKENAAIKKEAEKYRKEAAKWYQKAENLKDYFNNEWSVANGDISSYARGLSTDGTTKYTGFGKENSWFMPMKLITEPGERTDNYIDMILENLGDGIGTTENAPSNLEAYTYIPDMLFQYNRNDDAWKWMKYITSIKDEPHERASQGTNGDYPEISFTFVSHVVEGMMGVEPDAGKSFIATSPRLPEDVTDVTAQYMDIGDYDLDLTHNSNTASELTNNSDKSITWEARFYGNYKYIRIGKKVVKAEHKEINGETVSYASVKVNAGASVKAEATNRKK